MRRILVWSTVALTLSGAPGPSPAQVLPPSVLPGLGPSAARQAVDVSQRPWRGVVRVQTDVGQRCTGAMIGAALVLTAAHCLFGRNTGRVVRPGSIHVLTGYRNGVFDGHARAVAVEIGAGFALGPDGQKVPASPRDADWALLTLDTRLGTPDRVLPLARQVPAPGSPLMLGGYEQDRAEVLVADVACQALGTVRSGNDRLLRHSCAATRGASGAPLLGPVAGQGWEVVGVASIAELGGVGGYAVPAAAIADRFAALSPPATVMARSLLASGRSAGE